MRLVTLAATSALTLAMMAPDPAHTADWAVDTEASFVQFAYLENEKRRTGRFGMINPQLTLDPDNLGKTRGSIKVSTGSLDLGDSLREGILVTRPWLDSKNFPDATFVVDRVDPGKRPDQAVAVGHLEIKGVSRPLSTPIAITRQGNRVTATGELHFDRTAYGLRDSVVESFVSIGDEITLGFELVAHQHR